MKVVNGLTPSNVVLWPILTVIFPEVFVLFLLNYLPMTGSLRPMMVKSLPLNCRLNFPLLDAERGSGWKASDNASRNVSAGSGNRSSSSSSKKKAGKVNKNGERISSSSADKRGRQGQQAWGAIFFIRESDR
jgi:hypothetical protein